MKSLSLLLVMITAGTSFLMPVKAEENRPLTAVTVSQTGTVTTSTGNAVASRKARTSEVLEAVPVEAPEDSRIYVNDFFGFSRSDFVSYLVEHADSYLGTPYGPDASLVPLPGKDGHMQCEGFVWSAMAAVATENKDDIPCSNALTNVANGGGWVNWTYFHGVEPYVFSSKEEMLASGILEKGDVIWSFDAAGPYGLSANHHTGLFWGDTADEDCFWHSASMTDDPVFAGDNGCNRISTIVSMAAAPSEWWVFKLSPDATYDANRWNNLPQAYSHASAGETEEEDKELIFFD